MAMQVIWQKDAQRELQKVLRYGKENFGIRVMERFYEQIGRYEVLLAANPYMGPLEPLLAERRTSYRSFVVHEHYKLIYWVDEEKEILYVSDLWDTRREPEGLVKGTPNK